MDNEELEENIFSTYLLKQVQATKHKKAST